MSDFHRQIVTRGSPLWLGARALRNWYYNQGATFPRVTDFERRLAVAAIEHLPKHFGRSGTNYTKLHESFHTSLNQAKNWWNQQHQRIIHLKPHPDFKTRPRVDHSLSMPHQYHALPSLRPRTKAWYDHWHNQGYGADVGHVRPGITHTPGHGKFYKMPGPYHRPYRPYGRTAMSRRTRRSPYKQTYGTRPFTRRMRPELKFRTRDITPVNLAIAGDFLTGADNLLGLAQGTSESTRLGRKITLKSLGIKGRLTWDPTVADQFNRCRVMVVHDTQANGAVPAAVTTLLQTADIDSYRNLLSGRRFRVLQDKTYTFNPTGSDQAEISSIVQKPFHFYKQWKKPLQITYSTNADEIAAMSNHNIFVFAISANETMQDITFNVISRIRYYDN